MIILLNCRVLRWFATCLSLALALIGCTSGDDRAAGKTPSTATLSTEPLCYNCLWIFQDSVVRNELIEVYSTRKFTDPLIGAELRLLLARIRSDSAEVCSAVREFERVAQTETLPDRKLLALETVAFTADYCGEAPRRPFARAAAAARKANQLHKAEIYRQLARRSFKPLFEPAPIDRALSPPANTTAFVLGASAIRVRSETTIVSQLERVGRDWLSYQMGYNFIQPRSKAAQLLNYHEGARLRDIVNAVGAQVLPVTGEIAVQIEDRWYTADGAGVFRFEVLPDKVQYPTTRSWQGVALLVDTHGISALVGPALFHHADLVVGCGDFAGKMEAAAFLARRGVDVYYPTDRFASEVLGYVGAGVLVGSAPVRREGGVAVIGDRPVTFDVGEPIVVQTTLLHGELQYYDAPGRYFAQLGKALPLQLEYVAVDAAGRSSAVVDRAVEIGAKAIAVRVWTDEDYEPVRAWLDAAPEHRAVLFHSVAYPAGARLFVDFPRQTTFGDARPRFITTPVAAATRAGTAEPGLERPAGIDGNRPVFVAGISYRRELRQP